MIRTSCVGNNFRVINGVESVRCGCKVCGVMECGVYNSLVG